MILHVVHLEKFIPSFIGFVEENYVGFDQHKFFIFGDTVKYPVKVRDNLIFATDYGRYGAYLMLAQLMNKADRIILHGLFSIRITQSLMLMPWLLKRCYWVMWGGDLYCHQMGERSFIYYKDEFFRSFVIKRLGYLVTYIPGDYELAREWYGANGIYQECLMYLSNVYEPMVLRPKTSQTINILAGNSAGPTNNHLDIFSKLLPFREEDIRIYCPLSYGNQFYAKAIAAKGRELFGDKFVPLLDLMEFDDYKKLLGEIDIAIFAHRRQQAMGNTITLLGAGKKVFMYSDITPWRLFCDMGIKVFDIELFNLSVLELSVADSNSRLIADRFNLGVLIKQYGDIFNK